MEDDWPEHEDQAWNALDDETRILVTGYVFRRVVKHAREGGSFRYLIYDRLGLDLNAYLPLYMAGGMEISNEFKMGDRDEH
ncbi:hypothetical protein UFOVP1071_58 [uncultured Caudovirales phage]|jgi:hypothetical protein|uniref:Uncharacterized protein n=1 Tax=uncultured Caudovirales phage TaxID=2100421 RepID=A0A6J5QL79_9CAUD|nr:hypothetical protein UFOVP1071_58 [uncultured Caudovirales phage]